MYFEVIRMYTHGVKREPNDVPLSEAVQGDLKIGVKRCEGAAGHARQAVLVAPGTQQHLLPPLVNVRVDTMSTRAFTVIGHEQEGGQMYLQTWRCRVVQTL